MEDDEPHATLFVFKDLIKPFRGWIQVFSPNHPPKKVLAVGCGISMAVLGRISKHKKQHTS